MSKQLDYCTKKQTNMAITKPSIIFKSILFENICNFKII